ncbi:recombinase zinc beta ribbon domain-containing protein [Pseudomonas sp. MOIL14HWK12:I2]|uniref:recombinase zinc beta ribbon domain-containing protein n=1 Tax=Pseudomonas sp. MOIL14HWK12:I2 TaxID=1033994 RepID=UPI0012EC6EE0|nr:recombinase zinc beta ribbon domain-containing protein [Pseudomonas sp. MOIL14HWK12:I2]
MFERKAKGGKKQSQNENIFAGIAKCAHCGNSLRFQKLGGGDTKYRYLVCLGSNGGSALAKKTLSTSYNAFLANFLKLATTSILIRSFKKTKAMTLASKKNCFR